MSSAILPPHARFAKKLDSEAREGLKKTKMRMVTD